MSKKKDKKSKKIKDNILSWLDKDKRNIKILESGKIIVRKDKKIDIGPFIESTINDAKISRLEGIPTREEIVVDNTENYRVNLNINCSPIRRTVEMVSNIDSVDIQTIVIPMSKKKACSLEEDKTVEWLCKTSSFMAVYNKLKEPWLELNIDDETQFTNVLYVPKIYIFLDKKGKIRKKPIMVNLLITAMPSINNAKPGIEAMDEMEYTNHIITDTIDACIRCGCKSIIIDPYAMNALQSDVHHTAEFWFSQIDTVRFVENVKNITFNINNDDLFVIFCKNKRQE